MNKKIKNEKEINLSHNLSTRVNLRKERLELNEYQQRSTAKLKTA